MVFILCFAEVSSQFDKTGGPYLYAHNALGPLAGFLTGWLLMLGRIFNYGTLINLLIIYLSFFSDIFNDPIVRNSCIVGITAILGYINHRGVKDSTLVNNSLTITKMIPLLLFIIVGLFYLSPDAVKLPPTMDVPAFSTSVLLLIFAFGGFESVLINSGEIREPRKNLPFALITATIIVTIFYCLIQLVAIGTHPSLATSAKPLAEAATYFMGTTGGKIIALGAVISITGTLNAIVLGGSRLPFAFSNEGQFPALFSGIHPVRSTPTWSILLFIGLITFVSLAWSFITALTIGAIVRVMLYLMVCLSMIRLRMKNPDKKDYFKLRFGYAFAFAGILFACWLLSGSTLVELRNVGIAAAIGLGFYFLYVYAIKKKSQ
jgi:amino acid transporter